MLWGLYPKVFGHVNIMIRLEYIFFGVGATLALARNPEGLFGELRSLGALVARPFTGKAGQSNAPVPVAGGSE
jgi:hypothetical protein